MFPSSLVLCIINNYLLDFRPPTDAWSHLPKSKYPQLNAIELNVEILKFCFHGFFLPHSPLNEYFLASLYQCFKPSSSLNNEFGCQSQLFRQRNETRLHPSGQRNFFWGVMQPCFMTVRDSCVEIDERMLRKNVFLMLSWRQR